MSAVGSTGGDMSAVGSTGDDDTTPWTNGYYWCEEFPNHFFLVEGENATTKKMNILDGQRDGKESWNFGDFGEAHPEVAKATGKNKYDVKMTLMNGKIPLKGVLSDDGKEVTFWSFINEVASYKWIPEEEVNRLKHFGDPVEAPSSHYKIQPEKAGKLLFISGPPGLGKSTTGHMLSKMAGYVYYEGDCFPSGVNPYLPPDAKEPSLHTMKQKPLLGLSKERIDACINGSRNFKAMMEGKEYDKKDFESFYGAMCEDIAKERKRMGGDWVIAQAVPKRDLRDFIKAQLGPDLVFVVLNMPKEDQERRLKARHAGLGEGGKVFNDMLKKFYDIYEPATDDEENAIDLIVTSDMTREDVVEKILKLVN